MRKSQILLAGAAALVAPAVLTAPARRDRETRESIDTIVKASRGTGLEGWALVDDATRRVHDAFDHHSLWHLWEGSGSALAHGRGWSAQYNGALMLVLRELGFDATMVHASRVRGLGRNPWWQAGHSWLQVRHEGRVRDVCASRVTNRSGEVGFVPVTTVRPMNRWTRALVSGAMAPVVGAQAWRQLMGGEVPKWLYRDFDEML